MIHSHLLSHPKWKPVTQLYYSKYHTVVRVETVTPSSQRWPAKKKLHIPEKFAGTYKIVERLDWSTYWESAIASDEGYPTNTNNTYVTVSSVYTNDIELIDYILTLGSTSAVAEIRSPRSEQHLDYISDQNRTYVYRNHLWYKKYAHKITIWIKPELRYSVDHELIPSVTQQIYNLFDPSTSHWTGKRLPYYNHFRSHWAPIALYTNDEPAIMLLKMTTGDVFDINIETAITKETV